MWWGSWRLLVLCAPVLVGVKVMRWYRNHDPATLRTLGEVAEKAGKLKEAAGDYANAAYQLSRRHDLGADELYIRAAELSMKISASADNEDDAINYYDNAVSWYHAASTENPLNKVANENLLDMNYQDAAFPTWARIGCRWMTPPAR